MSKSNKKIKETSKKTNDTGFRAKYFIEQEKYSKIYGDKTIVFFQNGKFYDAYCNKTKGYSKLAELEPLLNIHFIRRDDQAKFNYGELMPNQFGIHCVSIEKNLIKLVDNGYTIVLFDQTTEGEENIERVFAGVYSPGTYITDRQLQDNNYYIMNAYIAEERQLKSNKSLMAIGLTLTDVSTGNSMIHEFYSDKMDDKLGMDELVRIMQMFRPVESVIYFHPISLDENFIKNMKEYLELEKYKNTLFYVYHDKKGNDDLNLLHEDMFKINYQNDYLSKIFDLGSQLELGGKKSAIEILGLERNSYSTISLIMMINYISEHNVLLLKNLSIPEIYNHNKYLVLGNNAIEQLNVIDSNNLEFYNKKFQSLFDVVNKTSTPMGKRLLKENLINPLSQENRQMIHNRYDLIEELLKEKLFKDVRSELKNIFDMERLHRKMAMGTITPYDFYRLDLFYQTATKIIGHIKKNKKIMNLLPKKVLKDFLALQIKYNREYDFEKLKKYINFSSIDASFFKIGIYPQIDEIQEKIDYAWIFINSAKDYLLGLISGIATKSKGKDIIEIETNDRDGYYFTISKTNERKLKEILKNKRDSIKIELGPEETLTIKKHDITFKQLPKGRTKIFIEQLIDHTTGLTTDINRLTKLIKKTFIKSMVGYYRENKVIMHKMCKFIAEIDFLVSGADVASEYYYCKPIIPSEEKIPSYIKAKNLRHAIIERLCKETEYVPNDVELGNVPNDYQTNSDSKDTEMGMNGILLFGTNAVGKTAFMKSIGVAIILAQIGYYVPAEEFIYEPYLALYARITGNDNIFKGLSSFAVEMTEMDTILVRTPKCGSSTLIIGDEICRGTEYISAISIVAAGLEALSQNKCTFILSSHLHELTDMEEIKALTNLRFFHLKVEENKDFIIYNRKLMPGSGPRDYGLTVAKYFIRDKIFINRAEIIKKRLLGEKKINMPLKSSNYNKDLPVGECSICNYRPLNDNYKELESHHIHFQRNCLEDGKIKEKPYLNKNMLYNLVVLCRKCHNKVHQGEIVMRGYADTSAGPMLDYSIDVKKRLTDDLYKLYKFTKRSASSQQNRSTSSQQNRSKRANLKFSD